MKSQYDEAYARSLRDPEGFWGAAAEDIHWERRWDRVLDDSRPPFYRWFTGGVLNTCYNALDRHVERGRGEQPALIYDSPVTGTVATLHLRRAARRGRARAPARCAAQGVGKGDRVIIYMPMVPEAVVAMLACARLGAVHSRRLRRLRAPTSWRSASTTRRPKLIVSASCGIEVGPRRPLQAAARRRHRARHAQAGALHRSCSGRS